MNTEKTNTNTNANAPAPALFQGRVPSWPVVEDLPPVTDYFGNESCHLTFASEHVLAGNQVDISIAPQIPFRAFRLVVAEDTSLDLRIAEVRVGNVICMPYGNEPIRSRHLIPPTRAR